MFCSYSLLICICFIGIGLGWQLQKLGKRNVKKTGFVKLKNELMAQASTGKKSGYELTFIDSSIGQTETSVSAPNSPETESTEASNYYYCAIPSLFWRWCS